MGKIENSKKQEIIDTIRSLASSGLSLYQISLQIPIVSRETIKSWALKNSIAITSKSSRYDDVKKEISKLYKNGATVKELKALGHCYDLIKNAVTENGLEWRGRDDVSKHRSLSPEEALAQLPKNSEYSFVKKAKEDKYWFYYFKDGMGNVFKKTPSHIHQGSPFITGRMLPYTEEDYLERCKAIDHTLVKFELGNIKEVTVTVKCNKAGHERTLSVAHNLFMLHSECPSCNNNGTSRPEMQIQNFLNNLGISSYKFKFPAEGKGRKPEIDVYSPDMKIGIEYSGLYYHSEEVKQKAMEEFLNKKFLELGPKSKEYKKIVKLLTRERPKLSLPLDDLRTFLCHPQKHHLAKRFMSLQQGIRLITIFEDEWLFRRVQVEGRLKSLFGKTQKIFARKTEVASIDGKTASKFFEKHHLQGRAGNFIYGVGLYYNGDLVAVASLGNHHRKSDSIALDRLCFKDGIRVVGGASRLFAHLKNWAKQNGHARIISWSDNRWSEGDVYKALGFSLEEDMIPDYFYFKNYKRYSKQSLKKTKEERLFGKTEYQLRSEQGYHRIWDCGKKRWVFNL